MLSATNQLRLSAAASAAFYTAVSTAAVAQQPKSEAESEAEPIPAVSTDAGTLRDCASVLIPAASAVLYTAASTAAVAQQPKIEAENSAHPDNAVAGMQGMLMRSHSECAVRLAARAGLGATTTNCCSRREKGEAGKERQISTFMCTLLKRVQSAWRPGQGSVLRQLTVAVGEKRGQAGRPPTLLSAQPTCAFLSRCNQDETLAFTAV